MPEEEETPQAETPAPAPAPPKGSDVEENKAIAAIAYIGILFLIPLLTKKDSAFAQYHAKQGLVLFIAEIAWMFIGWMFIFLPFVGLFITWLGWIFWFVLFIIGLVNALNGRTQPLPVIGKLADSFKI